jgi:uncharacterized protein (DUF952 family)
MVRVYKILPSKDWEEAVAKGRYEGSAADAADGFIHLSAARQLAGTARKYFVGQEGLVLVAFDEESLSPLRWEASRGGDLFPHVYGAIATATAVWVKPLPVDGEDHVFPPEVES